MLDTNVGLENWDGGDVVIPYRALKQNTSKDIEGLEVYPGTFVCADNKTKHGKEMEVVLLKVRKTRTLYPPFTSTDKKKICWSSNGRTPDDDVENRQSGTCATCEHARKDVIYTLTLLDVAETKENGVPSVFFYRAKGTQERPVKQLVSAILSRGKSIQDFSVKMTAAKAEGRSGNYWTIMFKDMMPVDEDFVPVVQSAFKEFADGQVTNDIGTEDGEDSPF